MIYKHLLYTLFCSFKDGLEPDTSYRFRLVERGNDASTNQHPVKQNLISNVVKVQTEEEILFMLNPFGHGQNLVLSDNNLSVTNNINKKWNSVRATTGFSSGVHYWEVHIDKCVSKNIFIGVTTSSAVLDNYVGSDSQGWGYLANRAIWHNKGKSRSYGELYREGDTIGITLNFDTSTLSFSRNGKDLGVAVENIKGELYPAFSMYNKGDKISLLPGKCSSSKYTSGGAIIRSKLDQLMQTIILLESLYHQKDISYSTWEIIHNKFSTWQHGSVSRYKTLDGNFIEIDPSDSACEPFGFQVGDKVHTSIGEVKIVGATKYHIWYQTTGNLEIQKWK